MLFDHVAIEQDEGFGCHECDESNEGNEGYACEKSLGKICGLEKAEEKAGDASCKAAALWSASFKNKIAAEAAVAAYNAAESGSESYRGNRPEAYRIVDIGPESYLQGVK